ncbi:MAG: transposase [Methanosarcinaceae archaeon]
MNIITYQNELRPVLPTVFGAKEYREFRKTLEEMDHILTATGIEHRVLTQKIIEMNPHLSIKRQQLLYRRFRQALRYCILLGITELSYRKLSLRVADSHLFQWFTYTDSIGPIRPLSKSAIERFEKLFSGEEISDLIHELNRSAGDKEGAEKLLYQETAVRFDEIFADTTCVQANIHFPVDWVLFRDAARTLMKAIMLIRSHGLRHRIRDPKYFITAMNKLSIEMTHARKKKGSTKVRKNVLRKMKKLMKLIESHAGNYHQLLETYWQETDWSEIEARIVLDRMRNILDQLPAAVSQAHERIIGERRVANKDKILSLYDGDVRVLVRGKAGAEVEFGNALYLAEQADGLIVDWDFIQEQAPGDNKLVPQSLERMRKNYGSITSYTADRGFDSPENKIDLEQMNIINAICPRSVRELEERLEDESFCRLQKRRGATEARMGIFKNAYLGKPLKSKGFKNRKVRIEWCILSHNLWKLSTMAAERRKEIEDVLAKTA